MNSEAMKRACDKLGWKYTIKGEEILITDLGGKEQFRGEFALKVSGGIVTYNSYYLKNGRELVEEFKSVFFPLNVEYARDSIVRSFSSNGFTYKKDYLFRPTEEVADHFSMVCYTELPDEKEKRYEVAFSILKDGTVVTDSNYLPDDVNNKAHKSMDLLQDLFGRKRIMTKKPEYDIFIREYGHSSPVGNKNTTK